MSWKNRFANCSKLIFFLSGVAMTSAVWLFFYYTSRESPTQPRVAIAPGALGDSLLPQLQSVQPSATPKSKLPTTPKNFPVQVPEVVEEPPMPGVVDNLPIPKTIGEPPTPEVVKNPPVPEIVEKPAAFGTVVKPVIKPSS
jgi:hypothetical protein